MLRKFNNAICPTPLVITPDTPLLDYFSVALSAF